MRKYGHLFIDPTKYDGFFYFSRIVFVGLCPLCNNRIYRLNFLCSSQRRHCQ